MTQVNGMLLYYFKRYLVKKFGDEGYQELIKDIDPARKDTLDSTIIGMKWYDIETYDALLEKFNSKNPDLFDEYHLNLAKTLADGFFGFVISLLSWEKFTSNCSRLWPTVYNEGVVTVPEIDDNHTLIIVDGIKLSPLHFKGLIITLRGWADLLLKKPLNMTTKTEGAKIIFTITY